MPPHPFAKARRRDWVLAGIAVAAAIAVAVALVIRLTDDRAGSSKFTRVTPWKELRALPDIGTLEYSCGFPGGRQATRLSVPATAGTVAAGVDVAGSATSARVPPGARFTGPYGPPGVFTWKMVRELDGGGIEVTVHAQAPSAPPVRGGGCPKPKVVVFTVRPGGARR
jgi:hypothetical protein